MKKKSLPIVCAVFLVIAMTVQFFVSYHREKIALMRQMEYKMELAQKDFLFEIYDMHEATDEIAQFFNEFNTGTEDLCALLQTVLCDYPNLYCCYITFLPECSPTPGQWYCPSAYRVDVDSVFAYDAKDHISYKERDWYTGALKSGDEGHWSLPYHDGNHADLVFTHSQKVYDSEDRLVAVAGADYTLAWTERMLEEVKPYDDAVCQLFSSDGTLIVGSDDVTKVRDRIVFEKRLSPTDMRLVISVPKCHIRESITGISLITLAVLLSGLLIIGLLLRHVKNEHDELVRMETANKLIEKEMQIAHDIQMGILKGESLEAKGERENLQVEATLIPMREVGGDLYDYHYEGDELWFIIGDVSGKGVPAAMFMSAAVNLFRAAGGRAASPKQIMEEMNAVLSENNPSFTFVTAFIGRLNTSTGELLYCNAGHCAPLVAKGEGLEAKVLELEPNIPLGYNGNYSFIEQGCMIGEGETLVLYTDGITEARNEQRQMLGKERWCKIVERISGLVDERISGLVEQLLAEVKAFMGEAEQADDITLMTIRKTGAVEPLSLRVENRMDRWPQMRTALHNYGLCAGMEAKALKKTELAVEEAVVNIVNYSQAEWMELSLTLKPSNLQTKPVGLKLVISLRDNGVPFDPTQQAEVDTLRATAERQIGGLGITLLRKIADEVRYNRIEDINTLTIIKQL